MKSLTTVLVAAILVAGAWTAYVRADEPPPIDGTWEFSRFDKATGQEFTALKIILKSEGETLHGTAVWPCGTETPIAAGSIAGGRVSFKVTPGSVIQDYGGEFDGDVIRGRWAVGIAAFDWEARRAAAEVTAEQLHGRWKFEHGALGEFDTLELQRDGRFRLEHRDVALGSTTTSGTWSLKRRDVVLREERHEVGGQEVRDRTPRTEKLRIRQTADGLRLGKPLREFQPESTHREDAPEKPPTATEPRTATEGPIGFTTEHDVTFSQGRQEAFAGIAVEVDRRRGTPALRFDGLYAVRVEQEEWSSTTAQEMWREYREGQFAVLPTEVGEWVSLDGNLPIVIYLGGSAWLKCVNTRTEIR